MPTPGEVPASMREALTALLADVKGSRRVFQHLASVERALKHEDEQGEFLFRLSSDQLMTIQTQLDSLLDPDPLPGLVQLRMIVLEAFRVRRQAEACPALSDFNVAHKLEVSEVTPSAFERLHADWLEQVPLQR